MNSLIGAILLLLLAGAAVVIRKTYFYLPLAELKRQAKRRDPIAVKLYRVVAYGSSLRVLLWLIIGLSAAAAFVLLNYQLLLWAALLVAAVAIWLLFSWLPAGRLGRVSTRLTLMVTPAFAWLLNYLHPILSRLASPFESHHEVRGQHTGIYEREDLLELLDRQASQEDSRITDEELAIARRALTFSDRHVVDVLTPRAGIKVVSSDATVGPVLIDELHKSGQPFVLVSGETKNDMIGSLHVTTLGIKTSGHVRDHMDGPLHFLHERDSLAEALHAFLTTNQPLFAVVNSHGEFLGVVTIEAIMRELLGHLPGEDFEEYTDQSAVAARHDRKAEPEPEPSKESEEEEGEEPKPEEPEEADEAEPETEEKADPDEEDDDFESIELEDE
jgi:CBS domain containing-hemolysin-like protein